MSYILDALKKSEEERTKSGARPARSGFTFIKGTPPTKKNKFLFGLILTSFMLVSAAILGAGWWWSQKEQTGSEFTTPQLQPIAAEVETSIEATPESSSEASPPKLSPVANSSSIPSQPLLTSSVEIPYLEDMSPGFRQQIPALKFSGHVYSPEPGLRLIMINGAVVREGDPVGAELSLDEITRDGVIMRFQETLFQIKFL